MFAADPKTLSRLEPVVRRTIIIDPNASAVRLLADVMKGLGAREIYSESDEERALELARDVEPGIIFIERSGETLKGETLARRIRRSNMVCRMSPIIMVTNEATAAAIRGARDAGVHEFLRKPFTTGDLFKRVVNVATKPRPWVEAVGYVGPDRRRFNSGEYSGTRKRRGDAAADSVEATRAIRQQAATLKAVAVKTSDTQLAIAAGGLEAYMTAGPATKAGLAQPIGAIMALAQPSAAPMARAS